MHPNIWLNPIVNLNISVFHGSVMRIESSSNNKHRQFWMNRPEKNGNPRKSGRKKGIISAAAPEAPWPSWAVVPPKRWGSMSQELVTFQESTGKLIWVVVSNIFYFQPYLGKIPILTNYIFRMGGSTTT